MKRSQHPMGIEVISLNFSRDSGWSLGRPVNLAAPGELWWDVKDQWGHSGLMQESI